jgi:hypothetical protein
MMTSAERQGVEHVADPHSARGHLVLRQRLQPDLAPREARAGAGEQQRQRGIHAREPAPRIVEERDQEHDADGTYRDALEHAERAGFEAWPYWQPERPAHQPAQTRKPRR